MHRTLKITKTPSFLARSLNFDLVRLVGFEPTRLSAPPPQDGVSAVPPQPRDRYSL